MRAKKRGKPKRVLKNEEINILEKIARYSGMDCWFSVSPEGDCILDLEADKRRECKIPLKRGIKELNEGMVNYNDYRMTSEEVKVFEALLSDLDIENSILGPWEEGSRKRFQTA